VLFSIDAMTVLYELEHMKRALEETQHAMALSVPVWMVSYYLPCNDPSGYADCSAVTPVQCPSDVSFNSVTCQKFTTNMFNMNGEFRKHHVMELEAGHVMMLVGYNDEYETEDGYVGGLIMRNTWKDGVYALDEFGHSIRTRGSHSLAYFMQDISINDERFVCPNSRNPRNWYACGGGSIQTPEIVADCVTQMQNSATAKALYQPYHLLCRDGGVKKECMVDGVHTYYLLNSTDYGDDLTLMCFLEYNTATQQAMPICLNPRPIDDYALRFQPVAAEDLPNHEDWCGFYFFPYDLLRESNALFGGVFANDYHFTFAPQSFAANQNDYPGLDYSLLNAATSTMMQAPFPAFENVFPNSVTPP